MTPASIGAIRVDPTPSVQRVVARECIGLAGFAMSGSIVRKLAVVAPY